MTPVEKLVKADSLDEAGEWAGAAAVRVSATGLRPLPCRLRLPGCTEVYTFSLSAIGAVRTVVLPRLLVCHSDASSDLSPYQERYPTWAWDARDGWGHLLYNYLNRDYKILTFTPPEWMRFLLERVSRAAVDWVFLPGRDRLKRHHSRCAAFQRLMDGKPGLQAGRK